MNTKQLAALAVGCIIAANSVMADWTDYFWITSPSQANGFMALSPNSSVAIDNINFPLGSVQPAFAGTWSAGTLSASGVNGGQLQVSPVNPVDPTLPTTAFTLTELGGAGGVTAFFTINQPTAGDLFMPGYYFDWVCNFKPGTTAWYVDADGTHPIVGTLSQPNSGSDLFFKVDPTSPNTVYGFYVNGTDFNALQIQGWEGVPEPSSVAMGIVTLVGALGVAYRRVRKA
jgi:hypothetical protein